MKTYYTIKFTDFCGKEQDHRVLKKHSGGYTSDYLFETPSKAYAQRVCREINNNGVSARTVEHKCNN